MHLHHVLVEYLLLLASLSSAVYNVDDPGIARVGNFLSALAVTYIAGKRAEASVSHSENQSEGRNWHAVGLVLLIAALIIVGIAATAQSQMEHILRLYVTTFGAVSFYFAFFPVFERTFKTATQGLCLILTGSLIVSSLFVRWSWCLHGILGVSATLAALDMLRLRSFPVTVAVQLTLAMVNKNLELGLLDVIAPGLLIVQSAHFSSALSKPGYYFRILWLVTAAIFAVTFYTGELPLMKIFIPPGVYIIVATYHKDFSQLLRYPYLDEMVKKEY
eukprot:g2230.t1